MYVIAFYNSVNLACVMLTMYTYCTVRVQLVIKPISCSPRHQKTTGKVDTSGFDYAQADSIVVTFHVLFPHEMWGWNERNKLVMFFGGQNLGNWRAGMGNFAARCAFVMKCI